jgi:8-oxo-dGTP pyrophosphatase MutT (NUDIX family)
MNFKQKIKKLYYFFRNPVYKLYCFIFRPKSLGVKVVVENNNKLLMVRIGYAHKGWTFSGGGVGKHESFKEAGLRELEEEVGIKAQDIIEMGEYSSERYFKKNIVKCFYLHTNSSFVKIDNFEIVESGWHDPEKLPENCSFAVPKIIEIYKDFKEKHK